MTGGMKRRPSQHALRDFIGLIAPELIGSITGTAGSFFDLFQTLVR
jgi:hypothetical protein